MGSILDWIINHVAALFSPAVALHRSCPLPKVKLTGGEHGKMEGQSPGQGAGGETQQDSVIGLEPSREETEEPPVSASNSSKCNDA